MKKVIVVGLTGPQEMVQLDSGLIVPTKTAIEKLKREAEPVREQIERARFAERTSSLPN